MATPDKTQPQSKTKTAKPLLAVPFHSLGISQIFSYGLLFYVFAQLKTPLALALDCPESDILMAVSGALILNAILAPKVGAMVDRYGALYILSRGLVIGGFGMGLLPFITSITGLWVAMVFIGIGYAMSTYETAFAAAVQLDEKNSRRHISYITFYGGVASSITWLTVAPLYLAGGLMTTCLVITGVLGAMAWRCAVLNRRYGHQNPILKQDKPPAFNWSILNRDERWAISALALSSSLEYLIFASTTLLWINWFNAQFNDLNLAIILASIYGPFQVLGRVIEMRFGHTHDARITGGIAFLCIPLALILVQIQSLPIAVVSMAIFGIGHGVLTVTFGFVTNMYFRAEVYGRAKGWIVLPRGIGTAFGPSIGGILFVAGADLFFGFMIATSVLSGLAFIALLAIKPNNHI